MVRHLRPPRSATRMMLALALLALVLRALVPAGYMPGSHDGQGGPFTLMLCYPPVGKTLSVALDAAVGHGAHHGGDHAGHHGDEARGESRDVAPAAMHLADAEPDADDDRISMQSCPFCMVAAQAMLPTADLTVQLAAVSASRLPVAMAVWHSPITAQGPPLGSRAPPFHLG